MKSKLRQIDGLVYRCYDVGCDDFERAKLNRKIIKESLFATGYKLVEEALRRTPLGKPLPSWITLGELPVVGKKDWRQNSGGNHGLEMLDDIGQGT